MTFKGVFLNLGAVGANRSPALGHGGDFGLQHTDLHLRYQPFAAGFGRLRTAGRRNFGPFPPGIGDPTGSIASLGAFAQIDNSGVFRHERANFAHIPRETVFMTVVNWLDINGLRPSLKQAFGLLRADSARRAGRRS